VADAAFFQHMDAVGEGKREIHSLLGQQDDQVLRLPRLTPPSVTAKARPRGTPSNANASCARSSFLPRPRTIDSSRAVPSCQPTPTSHPGYLTP
jgi:hypothetical protein